MFLSTVDTICFFENILFEQENKIKIKIKQKLDA